MPEKPPSIRCECRLAMLVQCSSAVTTMRRLLLVQVNANAACTLGCFDHGSSAGRRPLDLRPGSALLWRAAGAQRNGSLPRPSCPAIVVALGASRARTHSPVRRNCYRKRRGISPIIARLVMATMEAAIPRSAGIYIRPRPTCAFRYAAAQRRRDLLHHSQRRALDRHARLG